MSTSPESRGEGAGNRARAYADSPYEQRYGFCRALRAGGRIVVSGTAPIWPDGSCDPDPAAQARRCLAIIEAALGELGADMSAVVRTRMLITEAAIADTIGEVHREYFGEHPPAATMVVVAGLLDERWLVEIEAEAVEPAGSAPESR